MTVTTVIGIVITQYTQNLSETDHSCLFDSGSVVRAKKLMPSIDYKDLARAQQQEGLGKGSDDN
jgi:hypothetical protein